MITDLTYTARGRLATRSVGGAGVPTELTTYTYDNAGQLKTLTLPGNVVVSYSYDSAHRLTGISGGGNSLTYTLDNAGNRILEKRADFNGLLGKTISREYDTLNRLTRITGAAQ